jgi:Catalytic LigB subunit of aromatic ring-opening dioxygenase
MARIVLGLGTSHTPMLLVDPSDLPRYEENDRRLSLLDNDGGPITFDRLLAREADRHAHDVTAAHLSARHAAAQQAIAGLSDALATADLDALVVIGDDQKEMLRGPVIPSLLVYAGATIRSERPPHAPGRPEWVLRASDRYYPAGGPQNYPVAQSLGQHLSVHLKAQGFDVAAAELESGGAPMGHAFAFVQSQLMRDLSVPVVPVLLNALYPPNQPTPDRCLEIGEAIGRAIEAFPEDARIGVVASGGLSHFVVDEDLDLTVVRALTDGDHAALANLPVHKLNSGNAEIRNWICAAGALRSLRIERIDYIPGYRTRAGTGTGLCFALWR